jgi:pyrimidine-specific ribonucleoside hydrolase
MNRKSLVILGVTLGTLALIALLLGPAAPLLVRLGVKPICIQGELPNVRIVACPGTAQTQPSVAALPLPTTPAGSPIPIIVDDDGSPDGVIALLFFLSNPQFDVKAVTVSPGEAHPDLFASHVKRLLVAVGKSGIPVGIGRATPLEGDNAFPEPWRQGSDDFWGISLPDSPSGSEPVPAAELIVQIVSGSDKPVSIFISGTHTNLAEALRLDPAIREQIGDVFVMGGSIYVPGNIESEWPSISNNVAEWNIWVDPVAAREVFASGLPLHIMPLDGTNQVTWTRSDAHAWADSETSEGSLAASVLGSMLDAWSGDRVYIWDLAAAVALTDSRLCPQTPLALDIETEPGPQQGRTVISDGPANTEVCLEPDSEQIKARAEVVLGK